MIVNKTKVNFHEESFIQGRSLNLPIKPLALKTPTKFKFLQQKILPMTSQEEIEYLKSKKSSNLQGIQITSSAVKSKDHETTSKNFELKYRSNQTKVRSSENEGNNSLLDGSNNFNSNFVSPPFKQLKLHFTSNNSEDKNLRMKPIHPYLNNMTNRSIGVINRAQFYDYNQFYTDEEGHQDDTTKCNQ